MSWTMITFPEAKLNTATALSVGSVPLARVTNRLPVSEALTLPSAIAVDPYPSVAAAAVRVQWQHRTPGRRFGLEPAADRAYRDSKATRSGRGVITVDTASWPTNDQVAVVRDIAIHVVPEDHLVSGSVNASVPVGTTTWRYAVIPGRWVTNDLALRSSATPLFASSQIPKSSGTAFPWTWGISVATQERLPVILACADWGGTRGGKTTWSGE
jgi:hypothetical protein